MRANFPTGRSLPAKDKNTRSVNVLCDLGSVVCATAGAFCENCTVTFKFRPWFFLSGGRQIIFVSHALIPMGFRTKHFFFEVHWEENSGEVWNHFNLKAIGDRWDVAICAAEGGQKSWKVVEKTFGQTASQKKMPHGMVRRPVSALWRIFFYHTDDILIRPDKMLIRPDDILIRPYDFMCIR